MSNCNNIDSREFFITERSLSFGSVCSMETISIGSDSKKERCYSSDERISDCSIDNTMKVNEYKLNNQLIDDDNNRRNRDVYFIYDSFQNSKYKNHLLNKENYKQNQISSSPNPVKWASTIAANYFKNMQLQSQIHPHHQTQSNSTQNPDQNKSKK